MQFVLPPSLGFTNVPTPIEKINAPKGYNLWVKRDDMTGLELSGNKIRKLDFLVKEALDQNADGIITCGGLQSNHCRAVAYLSQKLGLECILYLRGAPAETPTGNYFLNLLTNATIHCISAEAYQNIDSLMEAESEKLNKIGKKYYVIPEGGSNATGALGYYQCFYEISEQLVKQQIPVEAIVVASGSGGTHAGLLLGKISMKSDIDILSVNVCDDAAYFRNKITSIIEQFGKKYSVDLNLNNNDVSIYDGFVGRGYGEINDREVQLIKKMVRNEGIVFDPIYTAKSFLGLENLMLKDELKYKNILFIHTGGIFGIFPYAEYFV